MTIGTACPLRQWVLAATVTMTSNGQVAKSANWSSTTGRSPIQAAPIAAPTKPSSEIGVSSTRSLPNSSARPRVTPNAPPNAAHVLAQEEDARVVGERVAEGLAYGLQVGDFVGRGQCVPVLETLRSPAPTPLPGSCRARLRRARAGWPRDRPRSRGRGT